LKILGDGWDRKSGGVTDVPHAEVQSSPL